MFNSTRVLYESKMLDDVLYGLNSDINQISPFSRANFVSDYFAFAENTPLTGIDIEQENNTKFI